MAVRMYCNRKRTSAAVALDLRRAIELGKYAAVKLAIARNRHTIHTPTGRAADLPVHVAARVGNQSIIMLLSDSGADLNARNAHRETPLHIAVANNKYYAIDMLMGYGADPTTIDEYDRTPLELAVMLDQKRCLETMLTRDISKNALNKTLFCAATWDNTILMNRLLIHGADIEYKDPKTEYTALLNTVKRNHVKSTQFLLEKGANPAVHDSSWCTCLHLIVEQWYPIHVVMLLLERCHEWLIDCRTRDEMHETALHMAARRGNVAAAYALIHHGASLDPLDGFLQTPLHAAVSWRRNDVVRLLLQAGASVNRVSGSGQLPLNLAVEYEDTALAQILLDHGAFVVDPCDNSLNATIIQEVCNSGDTDMLKLLLAYTDPAKLQAMHENGRLNPPLVAAAALGRSGAVRALLARGVNVNVRIADGSTALHAAVRSPSGASALVDTLLDSGACIDARDVAAGLRPIDVAVQKWGRRAAVTAHLVHSVRLTKAVVRHDVNTVRTLLACGVSPNVTTAAYGTPLHVAVRHKKYRMMATILQSMRCRTAVRHNGLTPLDHALAAGDERAVKMITWHDMRLRSRRTRHVSLSRHVAAVDRRRRMSI